MTVFLRTAVMILAAAPVLAFQNSAEFDAVSIKPRPFGPNNSLWRFNAGSFTSTNTSLKTLIELAYNLKDFQLSGVSGWMESDHDDVVARWSGNPQLPQSAVKLMLQKMLADRFQLRTHRETKQASVYSLVIAKNGPKLQSNTDAPGPAWGSGSGHIDAHKVTLSLLSSVLEQQLDRPVRDHTGLTGEYDVKLEWARNSADTTAPSLFTAIQEQLGLKLQSAKDAISILVVESAEHPSPN